MASWSSWFRSSSVRGDLLATLYQYLGVPLDTQFNDHAGRPTPILPEGAPIDELI